MIFTKIIWPLYKKYLMIRAQIVGDELLPYIKNGYSVLDFGGSVMHTTRYVLSKKKYR
jgi:hypothetical protein